MIKVCHIVDELGVGGTEMNLKEIALNLRDKYDHEIWCLKGKGVMAPEIEKNGLSVRAFDFRGGIKFSSILILTRDMKKKRFGIVHCHGLFPSIWGRIAALLAGVPVRIVHCQNLYYGITSWARMKLIFLSNFTTKIIAVSEAVKRSLVEYVGIDRLKIEVVYNCSKKFAIPSPETRKNARAELGVIDGDFVVGSISRLEEHKGHRCLLEAVAKIKDNMPHLKCLIVGDGPAMEILKQKARDLKLDDIVIFSGFRADTETMLSIMDIFVLPSTIREGLPLTLAEAAAAALPLIATSVGGNPEIVFDGRNGFVIEPNNAEEIAAKIKYLSDNRSDIKKMGDESLKIWKRKFTLEEMLRKIDSLYQSLI